MDLGTKLLFNVHRAHRDTCAQDNQDYSVQYTTRIKTSNTLEVLVLDELHDDVLLGLDLEHLQRQTEERRWLDVSAVNSPDKLQLHRLVHHKLGCEERKQKRCRVVYFTVVHYTTILIFDIFASSFRG